VQAPFGHPQNIHLFSPCRFIPRVARDEQAVSRVRIEFLRIAGSLAKAIPAVNGKDFPKGATRMLE
jgi:hypothetical protein